ncbi:Serine/threonine-protein kinase pkn1 [Streptomyces sp. S4.7]|uniref:formylglycine-generating enzyme family protein n=1 Tax=Streptomyces sp. S4.7 TaxID=2705439 RepID=UPI001398C87F|nr:formylglycine-generating enzyme family protein [Streptomyces sp. S4.7]QHY98843.1 Serine/threonine-protein kinase pkn1 [Streptomyces sp. S4.7]
MTTAEPQPRPACCAPQRETSRLVEAPAAEPSRSAAPGREPLRGWRELPGGTFLMGYDHGPYPADGEGPVREVTLDAFTISAGAVSNEEFAAFAEATGYVTGAERYGWSFVFEGFLPKSFPPTRSPMATPWWRQVHRADWRHPEGPGSGLRGRWDHPVVHVSHHDALAYCRWAGARLPTEAEWEYAARGGLVRQPYPWGAERDPGGEYRMNIFRGRFPGHNTAADGYRGTCPVDAFAPNAYGLYNTTGNVWEWCGDWFNPRFHRQGSRQNPTGPKFGEARVLKGGSHLCHESYCLRYRTSARMGNTPDSSSGNTGFRVALTR